MGARMYCSSGCLTHYILGIERTEILVMLSNLQALQGMTHLASTPNARAQPAEISTIIGL